MRRKIKKRISKAIVCVMLGLALIAMGVLKDGVICLLSYMTFRL